MVKEGEKINRTRHLLRTLEVTRDALEVTQSLEFMFGLPSA